MIEKLFKIDKKVLYLFQQINHPILDTIMRWITHSGDLNVLYICLGIYFYWTKQRYYAVNIILATGLVLIVCNVLLKNILKRTRPYDRFDDIKVKIFPKPNDFSMPSGHTFMAFGIAISLWGSVWMPWAIALAILMGISRLYVGVHYLSDVLVGAVLGILVGLCVVFYL